MNEPLITCPDCGAEIELTEALATSLHAELEAAHQTQLAHVHAPGLHASFHQLRTYLPALG
jgi:hypothetical protein